MFDSEKPLISVILFTYNHQLYIKKSLESILSQSHKNLEIIIHDDSSTDLTLNIIKEYITDSRIKLISRITNRHQRKIPVFLDIIEMCTGRYIALLDGDDYWSNPEKLKLQLDLLEQHTDFNICFTPASVIDMHGNETGKKWSYYGDKLSIATLSNVIQGDGGFMPTASLLIRTSALNQAPNWLYKFQPVGDYLIQTFCSKPNGAIYLPIITCCYRTGDPKSWTASTNRDLARKKIFEYEFIKMLFEIQDYFEENNSDFKKIIHTHLVNLINHSLESNDFNLLLKACSEYSYVNSIVSQRFSE
jgi:glycosyltransferase involved in cell wall biosynthesis